MTHATMDERVLYESHEQAILENFLDQLVRGEFVSDDDDGNDADFN
jgi:hypothetical protein